MSELYKDSNSNPVQAGLAPLSGATTSLVTAAAASTKTAALTEGLYRITSTAEVFIVRGPAATVVAAATDATLPALPHVEVFGIKAGDAIAVFDAGVGGATVKITKL